MSQEIMNDIVEINMSCMTLCNITRTALQQNKAAIDPSDVLYFKARLHYSTQLLAKQLSGLKNPLKKCLVSPYSVFHEDIAAT